MRKSIFYTTYGAYKNCGQFFDFLRDHFEYLIFLDLKSHHTAVSDKTKLSVYKKSELIFERKMFTPYKNPPVFLVPLYHFIYVLNILYALWLVRYKVRVKPEFFITSFSIWALGGCIGRVLGWCSKVILWSWDYYPIYKDNPYYIIQMLLEPFEILAIKWSNFSWYASQSNFDIRVKIGQIKDPNNTKHRVVHWGTGGNLTGPTPSNFLNTHKLRLVYFGAIHFEKGLALVMDSVDSLLKLTHNNLEIVFIGGGSPFRDELKKKVKDSAHEDYVKFYDFMSGEEFKNTAKDADLGLALFVPIVGGKINFSHYADPAKPRDYLANGLPILITKVPFIYKDIEKYDAGVVLQEFTVDDLVKAVEKYMQDPIKYREGAYTLSQIDRYDVYYAQQFKALD